MNILSSLNQSHFLPQKMPEVLAALDSTTARLSNRFKSSEDAANDEIVSLSDAGLALARRTSELGSAAVDMAENLIATFSQQLFGDAARGMKVTFDTTSLSAMSGASAALYSSSGPNGGSIAAAMSLQETADFVGKGQLTTADGHVYNFEVEVHYQALTQVTASSSTNHASHASGATQKALGPKAQAPVLQGLKAHFPGKLDDLLRLLDGDKLRFLFHAPVPAEGETKSQAGSGILNLRLLDLLESRAAGANDLGDTPELNQLTATDIRKTDSDLFKTPTLT